MTDEQLNKLTNKTIVVKEADDILENKELLETMRKMFDVHGKIRRTTESTVTIKECHLTIRSSDGKEIAG